MVNLSVTNYELSPA